MKIQAVALNKTVVFETPLAEEEDVFVRTGVLKSKYPILHCILHATLKEYVEMEQDDRENYANGILNSMHQGISMDAWSKLNNGLDARVSFENMLTSSVKSLYSFISKEEEKYLTVKPARTIVSKFIGRDPASSSYKNNMYIYNIIFDILTVKDLTDIILPSVFKEVLSIKEYKEKIISKVQKFLSKNDILNSANREKAESFKKKIIDFMTELIDQSEKEAYNEYNLLKRNKTEIVSKQTLETYSNYFKKNIFILDSINRMPNISLCTSIDNKKYKSIILLQINDSIFEVVGKLEVGNRIRREFDYDDILSETLRLNSVDDNDTEASSYDDSD